MSETPIRELFYKMLRDQCTEAETARIIAYLQNAERDEDIPGIDEIRKLLPESGQLNPATANRIFEGIAAMPTRGDRKAKLFFFRKSIHMAAACSALFLMLSVCGYLLLYKPKVAFQTAYEQLDSVRLADGTRIILNANTKIRMREDFMAEGQREVWLDGEAFFSVAHLPEKPFVVHTGQGMDIIVLGTAFNVNSRKDETRVVLSNGRIKAHYKADEQLLMPGEMLSIAPGNTQLLKVRTDTLYHASWRYRLLAFKDETLGQVANTIRDRYGLELVFADQTLEGLRFTGSVPADDLQLALHMIALAFELDIDRSGETITINYRQQ